MSLRLVPSTPEEPRPAPPAPVGETPARRRRRPWLKLGAALVCAAALAGAGWEYDRLTAMARAFTLDLRFPIEGGERRSVIEGMQVRFEETRARHTALVRHCELSMLDFRALLAMSRQLLDAEVRPGHGSASVMLVIITDEGDFIREGGIDPAALEPYDRFVIQHARGCLRDTDAAPPH